MADAEAVRLLYVAATRARDHLVLSLFRGDRSERSAAAVIELGLGEVAPEMCPVLPVVDYADVEIADFAAAAIDNGTLPANAEREWVRARQTRVEAAASPTTHATWWSPAARLDGAPLPRPPEGAAAVRRNVPLLARIDGVLVEERVDLAYRAANGYVLVLSGPDDALDRTLRGGRVALAFYQATGAQPVADPDRPA